MIFTLLVLKYDGMMVLQCKLYYSTGAVEFGEKDGWKV